MSEHNSHIEVQVGSERSFGLVFAFVFALIGLYPLIKGADIHIWALVLALVFGTLGLFAPRALVVPNRLWFKLGMLLGAIVAPIVMALVYLLTVLPIGLCFRVLGKDLLGRKLDPDAKTYWIEREQPVGSMKDQF